MCFSVLQGSKHWHRYKFPIPCTSEMAKHLRGTRAKEARAAAKTSYGSNADLARPTDKSRKKASVRPKRTITVAAEASTASQHHLAQYATSAAFGQKKTSDQRRLLPAEYDDRRRGGQLSDVRAVVCLIAHDGVVRPGDWVAFLRDPRVSIVIHSNKDLPTELKAFRYPCAAVTAWEDISLFNLMVGMVGYAVKTYQRVAYIYTCPGDGIPIAGGDAMEDPRRLQPSLPQGASLLGIPAVQDPAVKEKPTMPNWEPARVKAMATQGYLQPIPARCYGSMWIGLSRVDANLLLAMAPVEMPKLAKAYRAAYAHAGPEHAANHARLAPDEEFIPYLLHVVAGRPWPAAHYCIMAEKQASDSKCWQCAYRAGHGKVLTAKEEAKFKKGSARLFLRKVQGPGE